MRQGELLWTPSRERRAASRIAHFIDWLAAERELRFSTYDDLHAWSVSDLDGFWTAFTDWYGVRWHEQPDKALASKEMPGAQSPREAQWFPGGRLNYAEHLLNPPGDIDEAAIAVVAEREDGAHRDVTWAELRGMVASTAAWLRQHDIGRGDRVAALLPNGLEALVAVLATASIGAIWSSCSPDFGPQAVADRFTQIEPKVLFAVDGYLYGGKRFDIRDTVTALRHRLPSVQHVVLVSYLDDAANLDDSTAWAEMLKTQGELTFESMAFDDPLYVLYSSGTTGLPKPIVHCHGGILVEHVKQLALHFDLGPDDRFFWFSTTGWMMWNLLISGLAVGSAIVLYDGNPGYPDLGALWRLAERTGITCFGVSAPYLLSCLKSEVHPAEIADLSKVRSIGSTGAPLPPEGFGYVYEHVKTDVMLASMSGGTDVCTAFVGGVPLLPVRAGEIPARLLACAVEAFDAQGKPVVGEVGELVVTEPMPSMPIGFWNDPDGERFRASYFETYPGVWRHGDWVEFTERGSCIITGRSDSTLNRGGVRMGSSEFYSVVEGLPGVADSLVIDTSAAGAEGKLLLFVVLDDGVALADVTTEVRRQVRSQLSPRHVPDEVIAIPAVPRTLNGKKCEVPVKRVLSGVPLEQAVSGGALADQAAMQPFVELASQ